MDWLNKDWFCEENWIYKNTDDNRARFVLGKTFEPERSWSNPLVCFGINPSTAEPNLLDHTVTRVENYAKENGFDSWIMLNIYPLRSTDPNGLLPDKDPLMHSQNIEHITRILSKSKIKLWAAWGNSIIKQDYLFYCLEHIAYIANEYNCRWVKLGCTKDGHPIHPLYRGKGFKLYNAPLINFDMDEYLANNSDRLKRDPSECLDMLKRLLSAGGDKAEI